MGGPVLLFDGDCCFCRHVIRWLAEREAGSRLTFAPLQSPIGSALLVRAGLLPDYVESVVLVEEAAALTASDAVLAALRYLIAPWCWLAALRAIPRPIRDAAYEAVARHRPLISQWFGTTSCSWSPGRRLASRFLAW